MTRFRQLAIVAALGTMAAALGPAPSWATEVLTADGLGPVKINMTPAEAAKALGTKLRPMGEDPDSEECWITERADGKAPGIWYMVQNGHITRIDIGLDQDSGQAPDIRTEKGIGLGAPEQDVLKAYGKALKISQNPYGGAEDHYLLLDSKDGKAGLLLETEAGKVTTFRAGLHPAVDYSEGCS